MDTETKIKVMNILTAHKLGILSFEEAQSRIELMFIINKK